jgi:Family of unknown function (DUF5706)
VDWRKLRENKALAGDRKDKVIKAKEQRYFALTIAANNSRQLIAQADRKAHLLVQVNALMISVLLTFALRMPQQHQLVLLPIGMQLVACLAVIILSLTVTRPNLKDLPGPTSPDSRSAGSLLFFSTYAGMELDDYARQMEYVFGDTDHICSTLVREIFHQAIVLGKKFKFLRLAYMAFLLGTGGSIITSAILAIF